MSSTRDTLIQDGERRHNEWLDALEPQSGCSSEVYVQNPYTVHDEPEAFLIRIRVSRSPKATDQRHVRISSLLDAKPDGRLVFGDDEIYVANYENKPPYDSARPYYYPADRPQPSIFGPPAEQPIFLSALAAYQDDGCFHCIPRDPLCSSAATPASSRCSRPEAASAWGSVTLVWLAVYNGGRTLKENRPSDRLPPEGGPMNQLSAPVTLIVPTLTILTILTGLAAGWSLMRWQGP